MADRNAPRGMQMLLFAWWTAVLVVCQVPWLLALCVDGLRWAIDLVAKPADKAGAKALVRLEDLTKSINERADEPADYAD
jgi:hypothetical protein